jgi:hypothetical protein
LRFERQAGDEERQWLDAEKKWNDWASRTPEMMSYEALRRTQQTNPQRWAQIEKQVARHQQFLKAGRARIAEIAEIRQGRALQAAVQHQAQAAAARSQFNDAQDARFEQMVAKELPEFSKGDARRALSKAAKEELRSYGLTDQQISHEYNNGQLRSAEAQLMLAKAAVHRLVRENRIAMASKRPVPPVLTPGTSRPRGAGDIENVRALQRQLAGAKGRKSLDLAQQLTRAKRAAGLL